jgi:hypothetical protein
MRVLGRQGARSTGEPDARARQSAAPDDHARKAGWSGVVVAGLLMAAMLLVSRTPRLAAPDADYTQFYGRGGAATLIVVGLYLVPFAGIACLWHTIATRTLLQVRRPGSWAEIPHWL